MRLGMLIGVVTPLLLSSTSGSAAERVKFNRDIRPILAENCFACHGFDKNARKADLRLDTKEGLFTKGEGDAPPVVAGRPGESELIRRVTASDADEVMPPRKSNKKLTGEQIALLKRWIEEGAEWEGHWAYIKPERPAAPQAAGDGAAVRNDVDRFIAAGLTAAGLPRAPVADRVTLLRRVHFDLLGLPPTPAEVEAFLKDTSPTAYEKVVEKLLASPHFGERLAIVWLDLVRFADTIGYHSDNPRNITPYRDYVIDAFNSNKRFDQFTVEQIAGDLIPNATTWQQVASGYNRLLQTTEEGGAQPKEYTAKYAADRVRNVASVWMGATLGCAECHDHKYDPYTARDFYSMQAFFADVQEAAVGKREAGMPVPDELQSKELKRLDDAIAAATKALEEDSAELAAAQAEWEQDEAKGAPWVVLEPAEWSVVGESKLETVDGGILKSAGKPAAKETYRVVLKPKLSGITGLRLETLTDEASPGKGPGRFTTGNFVLTELKVEAEGDGKKRSAVKLTAAKATHSQEGHPVDNAIDGKRDTGWAILPRVGKDHEAVFEVETPLKNTGEAAAETILHVALEFTSRFDGHQIGKFRLSATTVENPIARWMPPAVRDALKVAAAERNESQKNAVRDYYRGITPLLGPARKELTSLKQQKDEVMKGVRMTLVTTAISAPRTVRVLSRGNWLDDSGEIVGPAVPVFLGTVSTSGDRATRMDLAKWLVSRENPLTARVFVNRLWKLYFGTGLSKSLEDFGAQGEWPTHPELLDWLAVEFMESGWDVKHVVRLMVTSDTYRQASTGSKEAREKDPGNRLLARQSAFRLDAELVRDNALAVAGLLSKRIGGESVRPYQPDHYWDFLNFPKRTYQHDSGEALYRRALYNWWQRTFMHPSLLAFDAPTREECTAERPRSNIPQQALVLLNDPIFVEAARVLGERIVTEGGDGTGARLSYAFKKALSREPSAREVEVLTKLVEKHRREYAEDRNAAAELVSTGEYRVAKDADAAELAAWTNAARVILNLHETITRY